jgi:MtN3 and saliva related transmembrane protein
MLLNNMNDAAWYALGAVAAVLTSFGFLPQAVKMWRTKSVRDVSPFTIAQFIVGVSLWAIYGVHLRDPVIIAANLISLSIFILALALYFRFFKRESRHKTDS